MKAFINFSNHPYAQWPQTQKDAAAVYGKAMDVPFPAVPADASSDYVKGLADNYVARISGMNPSAVMCQGEFTLAFAVVHGLMSQGVTVLAACSERKATEVVKSGTTQKHAIYEFIQFRNYV